MIGFMLLRFQEINKVTPELISYAKAAVKRGVKALDKGRPGWEEEIDLTQLDLSSPSFCMLGQIYGDFSYGCSALSEAARLAKEIEVGDLDGPARYGFEWPEAANSEGSGVGYVQPYYSLLTELWTTVIEQRRQKDVAVERKRRVGRTVV